MPSPALHLQLHGVAHWRHGKGPPHALERKHAALLAWLWVEGATPRSRLAGLLWPEASEERARGNLRQRLLKLRQDAGELLDDHAGVLQLKPAVQVDPPDPPGATLLQALEFDDCETFARWLEGQREATRERRKREWLAEVREAASSQRLDDALEQGRLAVQDARQSRLWTALLPALNFLGTHHAACGSFQTARSLLTEARDLRDRLYGPMASGLMIDIQLGHVLGCCGEFSASRGLLESARRVLARDEHNPSVRADLVLLDNHRAQLLMTQGLAEEAAQVLALDVGGVQDSHHGRRLGLRLRWQRLYGQVDATLVQELQALAQRTPAAISRAQITLELSRLQPAALAQTTLQALLGDPAVMQRPGVQLHAAALACRAAHDTGDSDAAARHARTGRDLLQRCEPCDMSADEARGLLGLRLALMANAPARVRMP